MSLVNLEGGYKCSKNVKVVVEVFNLFNAADSDIDYYYAFAGGLVHVLNSNVPDLVVAAGVASVVLSGAIWILRLKT